MDGGDDKGVFVSAMPGVPTRDAVPDAAATDAADEETGAVPTDSRAGVASAVLGTLARDRRRITTHALAPAWFHAVNGLTSAWFTALLALASSRFEWTATDDSAEVVISGSVVGAAFWVLCLGALCYVQGALFRWRRGLVGPDYDIVWGVLRPRGPRMMALSVVLLVAGVVCLVLAVTLPWMLPDVPDVGFLPALAMGVLAWWGTMLYERLWVRAVSAGRS